MPTIDDGLDIDSVRETSQDEIDIHLTRMWRNRGPLYLMSSASVMLDNRPDFAKLHRWGASLFGRPTPVDEVVGGLGNLHTYIHLGWEVGILNEFRNRQRQGVTKAQLLEVVMAAQLSAGMRGLECVYRAVGTLLPDFRDRPTPAPFPDGWEPDPAALRCGLDLSTRELTDQDRAALDRWYLDTIGEVPRSVAFAAKHHPKFLKAYRAKWERAIRALPKQVMPYLMLRHNTWTGNRAGMREAALLCKAWGVSREWTIKAVTQSVFYFAPLSTLSIAEDVLADVLDTWE